MRPRSLPLLFGKRPYRDRVLGTRRANLIAYYPLDDPAGSTTLRDISGNSGNVCQNPGFELLGAGGNDVFANWDEYTIGEAGGGVFVETSDVHSGGRAAKLVNGDATGYTRIIFEKTGSYFVPGQTYTLRFWCHGDGTTAPRYNVWDATNSASIIAEVSTGVTGTTYAQITNTFTVPATCTTVQLQFTAQFHVGCTIYFDDVEIIGPASANPLVATLAGSGTTLGQPGIGDGLRSVLFSGAGYANLPPALVNALTKAGGQTLIDRGSILVWNAFTEADVWSQADDRQYDKQLVTIDNASLGEDAYIYKCGGEAFMNSPVWNAGTGSAQSQPGSSGGDFASYGTAWACNAFTWDTTTGELYGYWNGRQWGITLYGPLVAWSYPPTNAQLAVYKTSSRLNKAYMAHLALWNEALTAGEISALARV